jgi:hypothetical protein
MRRHQEAAKAALAQMEDDDDIASESDLSGDEEPLEEGEEGISDDSADLMQGVTHHGDGSLSEGDEDDLDEDDGDVDDGEEDEPMQQKPPAGVPSARRPLAASADAAEAREQQDLLHPGAGQHSLDAALLQLQVRLHGWHCSKLWVLFRLLILTSSLPLCAPLCAPTGVRAVEGGAAEHVTLPG